MKKLFIPAVLSCLLFLNGCNAIKTVKVLKKGDVVQKNFKEQVTFESRAGLIVMKVKVNGKDYNFIFDSGAVNCVTKEVSEELKLKPVLDQTAEDAEGKKGGIKFVMLDELKIGNITVKNTSAAVIDLRAVPELSCLHVDGLIGANLMRKLFWQLDYRKQTVGFSDKLDSLLVPKTAFAIPFTPEISGTPTIELELEGLKSKGNIFDTGSSGAITISASAFKKAQSNNPNLKYIRGIGSSSAGLFGAGFDTSYTAKVNMKIGTLSLTNHIIDAKRDKGNVGSAFFKDYVITMDWSHSKMYFVPQEVKNAPWETFGFSLGKKNKGLAVTFLYDNSPATRAGLVRGDEIISINGKNYNDMSPEDYCETIAKTPAWKKEKTIELNYKTADGSLKTVKLEKQAMLE